MNRIHPGLVGLAAVASGAAAAPDFVPSPKQAFDGFVAIGAPRPEVPVGALWIERFGPSGAGAAPDNLETERSLNGLTIDRNLQVSLSAGLFELIGIEPRLRSHFTARFTDLSIVRVKDFSKLDGPRGEPRIVEALKAGSVTVSSDGEAGLNARSGWRLINYDANASAGRSRAYSIEARDMFIAVRVAREEKTESKERDLRLSGDGPNQQARLEDFVIRLAVEPCPATEACVPAASVTIEKPNSFSADAPLPSQAMVERQARVKLPVPIADERGGLYETVRLRWVPDCRTHNVDGCERRPRLTAAFEGNRMSDVKVGEAPSWK